MNRIFRWLRAVPELLLAYAALRADAEIALRDPDIRAALDRLKEDPAIGPLVPRFSAEWRAVENAVSRLR
jgi:hypothetical protein